MFSGQPSSDGLLCSEVQAERRQWQPSGLFWLSGNYPPTAGLLRWILPPLAARLTSRLVTDRVCRVGLLYLATEPRNSGKLWSCTATD